MKNNFFEFETKITQQISGTAIGINFAPPYACLFMDRMENDFLDSEIVKLWLWLRYVDDISLNNFQPNLKFTHEKSKSSVNFSDVSGSIADNKLETASFCKLVDCHHFLYCNPAHPFYNKKSIVYSQGLRIRRLCPSPLIFQKQLQNLKTWSSNTR